MKNMSLALIAMFALLLQGCTESFATPPQAGTEPLPRVLVHKNEYCGCCNGWVEHMRKAGFRVEVRNVDNLDPVKTRVGVPVGKGSCHTAEVGGYFIEGHVPACRRCRRASGSPRPSCRPCRLRVARIIPAGRGFPPG